MEGKFPGCRRRSRRWLLSLISCKDLGGSAPEVSGAGKSPCPVHGSGEAQHTGAPASEPGRSGTRPAAAFPGRVLEGLESNWHSQLHKEPSGPSGLSGSVLSCRKFLGRRGRCNAGSDWGDEPVLPLTAPRASPVTLQKSPKGSARRELAAPGSSRPRVPRRGAAQGPRGGVSFSP